jgi:LPS export ABC transporter protein LptC
MKNIKNLIFVVLLGFLFVEVLIVFPSKLEIEDDKSLRTRVENQEKRIKNKKLFEDDISKLSDQRMGGVHLVESQQGLRDWELFAKSAEGSQTSGTWKLHQVRVLFYNKDKVEFTVVGDHGSIDAKSKDLSILGNVSTQSENGYIFQTSSIFYSSQKRQILSPNQVTMTSPHDISGESLILKGRKMLVLVDESRMYINADVTAHKVMKNGLAFDVSANSAEFSGKSREAKFNGKVVIGYDKMQLEGPSAEFLFNGETDKLTSVLVDGGVKVTGADKSAVSKSVTLDLLANKYVFRGSPKVTQNEDELTGEEIIFLEGGKKVRIEKARAKLENRK